MERHWMTINFIESTARIVSIGFPVPMPRPNEPFFELGSPASLFIRKQVGGATFDERVDVACRL